MLGGSGGGGGAGWLAGADRREACCCVAAVTVVTAARTAVATVAADGVARGSADGGGGKDGADSPLGVDGNIVGTKAENFHCECSTTPHINGLGSVLRVHGLFLDQSASTLRAPGTVFFLRPFRALPRLLSLARRGVGRPRVMLVMQAEDQNPRHVPGVSCFRTCRECRRLASMPVPSPRGRQVQAQLAVALEKGLSLGGERPSPVASPDSSSPTGIWNGIANLPLEIHLRRLCVKWPTRSPSRSGGGGRRPAAVADARRTRGSGCAGNRRAAGLRPCRPVRAVCRDGRHAGSRCVGHADRLNLNSSRRSVRFAWLTRIALVMCHLVGPPRCWCPQAVSGYSRHKRARPAVMFQSFCTRESGHIMRRRGHF